MKIKKDKPVILITGCSSGIGKYSALELKKKGWQVYATARKKSDVNKLIKDGFDDALQLDVTKEENVINVIETILNQTNGRIDAIFNNAGFGQPGAIEDIPLKALKEQFETNVFGSHLVIKHVIPAMRNQGYGRIIQHSSIWGFVSPPFRGAYNSSKYAVEGMIDSLRLELVGTNIYPILMQTGPIITPFKENSSKKFSQWIDIEKSFHAKTYSSVHKRLNSSQEPKFSCGPDAVFPKLIHALESNNPKPRYHVTSHTHFFKAAKRLLPTSILDKVILWSRKEK